jgi:hypothetical protein
MRGVFSIHNVSNLTMENEELFAGDDVPPMHPQETRRVED